MLSKFTLLCLRKDLSFLRPFFADKPVELEAVDTYDIETGYTFPAGKVILGGIVRNGAGSKKLLPITSLLGMAPGGEEAELLLKLTSEASKEEIYSWLVKRIATNYLSALTSRADAELQLARLRIEHQKLIEDFELMGRRYATFRAPDRVSAASVDPGKTKIQLKGEVDPIKQLIPVKPAGVGEISLYFVNVDDFDASHVSVNLNILHTDDKFEFKTREADLNEGWNAFFIDKAVQTDFAYAELEVFCRDKLEKAPSLCLGPRTPLPEAAARYTSGVALNSPLAFKIWRFLPGSEVPSANIEQTPIISIAGDEKRRKVTTLDWGTLSQLTFVGEKPSDAPDQIVTYDEENGWVVVHPVKGVTCFASVGPFDLSAFSRISALVTLAHQDANPVEFAIGVVPVDPPAGELSGYLGQWTKLSALEWSEVSNVITEENEQASLMVATRMANDDDDPAWGWAAVTRIELS